MFFYTDSKDNQAPFTRAFRADDYDATLKWLEHYKKELELTWIANHPSTTINEKAQARRELIICERKQGYWRRQFNFNQYRATQEAIQAKRIWEAHAAKKR